MAGIQRKLSNTVRTFFDSGKAGGILLIGLELEREPYNCELPDLRNALLPIFAAASVIAVFASLVCMNRYLRISKRISRASA